MILCGCGRYAEFEIYDHKEKHCFQCMMDAIDCEDQVLVRKLDLSELYINPGGEEDGRLHSGNSEKA